MAADELRYDGRVAVVTGGGRGLGRTYAELLAARGARVVVNDLDTSAEGEQGSGGAASAVVAAIRAAGGEAVVSTHDITSPNQATEIVATALDAFGRLDIVVNNAGIVRRGVFADLSDEDFRAVFDTHVMGSVNVTQAAWPHLVSHAYGRVVMTTSAVGLWGSYGSTPYAMAKAALVGLARSLAHEGAPHGIKVNCVAPAAQTRMSEDRFAKPSRRWRPELVAPAVLYLAHEACELSGEVLSAFAGHFSRVQVVQGAGHCFDARGDVVVEDLVDRLDDVLSMEDARGFANGDFDALGTPLGIDLRTVAATSAVRPSPPDGVGPTAS